MPTKTLKQQLTDLLNKDYNDSHFDEQDIINIFKEWLNIHRIFHIEIAKEWETDQIDTYTIFTNLIGELQE